MHLTHFDSLQQSDQSISQVERFVHFALAIKIEKNTANTNAVVSISSGLFHVDFHDCYKRQTKTDPFPRR